MEHKHESDNEDAMKSKETHMYPQLRMMLLAEIITAPVFAETTEPKVKVFPAAGPDAKDRARRRSVAADMIVVFELSSTAWAGLAGRTE